MIIKFAETGSARDCDLTVNDVEFEIANIQYSVEKPTLLIIPNDDEYPIETMEFASINEAEKQMKAFNDEKEIW